MEPTNNNLDIISEWLYSIENITISIKEEKVSINSKEIKHLNQDLKKFIVDGIEVQRIAKGERRTNTFIKTYLIEYIKIRLTNPTETMVFMIPSIENIFWFCSSIDTIEFKILIRLEKQISVLRKLLPNISNRRWNKTI